MMFTKPFYKTNAKIKVFPENLSLYWIQGQSGIVLLYCICIVNKMIFSKK
jgi:hypothetical protein